VRIGRSVRDVRAGFKHEVGCELGALDLPHLMNHVL
jgi:hypothetical protein